MRKERVIMLVSSVFVLTALTMTGFYVKEKNETEKDGYIVDMSTLEKKTEDKTKEIVKSIEEEKGADTASAGNDLDYDPNFQEASSDGVTSVWDVQKKTDSMSTGTETSETADREVSERENSGTTDKKTDEKENSEKTNNETAVNEGSSVQTVQKSGTDAGMQAEAKETVSEAARALSFQEKDNLSWPVAGNVLINYSMDKTVYFPTLQQYKYSPAIVIAASEGENISASADGKVLSVYEDAEIGHAVVVDIGNGYELTYGQLDNIQVLKGDVISEGDVIGTVASPTKYYSVEGPNIYFKLTKDGAAVNPLSCLE